MGVSKVFYNRHSSSKKKGTWDPTNVPQLLVLSRTLSFNDDDGPFWMNEQERAAKKEDKVLEGQTKKQNFMKAELMQKLRERNILVSGTYKKMKKICEENQIQTHETQAKVVPG